MTNPNTSTNTKAAFAKLQAATLWWRAFDEPPPVTAEPRLMAAIIEEYAPGDDYRRGPSSVCDGSC